MGGIAVGHYRTESDRLDVSAPNACLPVVELPVMLRDIRAEHARRDCRHRLHPARPTVALACDDLRHA